MQKIQEKSVKGLLSYFPEELLDRLSERTCVDEHARKLQGKVMFKLLLYSILCNSKVSLRVMEHYYESRLFQRYMGLCPGSGVSHSSLSDRLSRMNVDFLRQLYEYSVRLFSANSPLISSLRTLIERVDSTVVSLSGKLLAQELGMTVGRKGSKEAERKRQIKYSLSFDGQIATSASIFSKPVHLSEDETLPAVIHEHPRSKYHIMTFDRGVTRRKSFDQMNEAGICFVTRLNLNSRFSQEEQVSHFQVSNDEHMIILEDMKVRLHGKEGYTRYAYRLVCAQRIKDGKEFWFLTNLLSPSALEIAEIYKQRWAVEVFFKFLKQHMNLTHLLSRNLNGMTIHLYVILIAAMLITIYQKNNQIKYPKMAKMAFEDELQMEIIAHIVSACGGDITRLEKVEKYRGLWI